MNHQDGPKWYGAMGYSANPIAADGNLFFRGFFNLLLSIFLRLGRR